VVHYCARGRGALSFQASPYVDLTPLQPTACGEAWHLETSYSEHYADIVHDFLKEEPR
jgi:hypothetical protein